MTPKRLALIFFSMFLVWATAIVLLIGNHNERIYECQRKCLPHTGRPLSGHCVCDLTTEVR